MPIFTTNPTEIEALEIVCSVMRHNHSSVYWIVEVENEQSKIFPVMCTSVKVPHLGDYVIFNGIDDVYVCPQHVFHAKYSEL